MPSGTLRDLVVLLGPPLAVLSIWVLYPIAATVIISLSSSGGLTLDNYVKVLSEQMPLRALVLLNPGPYPPWGALVHNAVWILITVPTVVFLGLVIAYLIRDVPGSSVIAGVVFIGMVLPGVVSGLVIRFMFDGDIGIFPKIFSALGTPLLSKTWTIYPQTSLLALVLGSIWLWLGFSVTLYLAGLESIPKSVVEAAVIDGASEWEIFAKIVAPQLKPVMLVVALMTTMWALKIFDIVYVVTGGGPGGSSTVLALVMYNYFAAALEYGKASAIAVFLALITLVPAALYVRILLRGERA
ncbi:MAG: sugar ABC transporter permease [Thermofilaceae archaeon]